jgi:hypothetical protein
MHLVCVKAIIKNMLQARASNGLGCVAEGLLLTLIMDAKTLAHLLEKRVKAIGDEATAIPPDFFPETIHRFRTETKKLMAVLRLAGMAMQHEPELPKAFRDLYHAAGQMRDCQMQMEFIALDKHHILPSFTIWLAHRAYSHQGIWKHKHVEKVLRELHDYIATLKFSDLNLETLHKFFDDHKRHMKVLIAGSADDEALHEVRKETKDMQLVLGFCKKNWEQGYTELADMQQELEQLSEKAGVYNDRRNLLIMLEEFKNEYSKEMDEGEILATLKAGGEWNEAKARERKVLIGRVRRLVK